VEVATDAVWALLAAHLLRAEPIVIAHACSARRAGSRRMTSAKPVNAGETVAWLSSGGSARSAPPALPARRRFRFRHPRRERVEAFSAVLAPLLRRPLLLHH
jgi:hypothetical protein